MKPNTRWIAGGAATLLVMVALGLGILAIPATQDTIFIHFVKRKLQAGSGPLLQGDDLKVLLCGTSAPLPIHIAHRAVPQSSQEASTTWSTQARAATGT